MENVRYEDGVIESMEGGGRDKGLVSNLLPMRMVHVKERD